VAEACYIEQAMQKIRKIIEAKAQQKAEKRKHAEEKNKRNDWSI